MIFADNSDISYLSTHSTVYIGRMHMFQQFGADLSHVLVFMRLLTVL